jgi:2',3'-cyclic-nucleotide 2'-phosphodiesterase/3'-nucleotidase
VSIRSLVGAAAVLGFALVAGAARVPQPERATLVIAATTDVHGRIRGWDYTLGRADPARSLAALATAVDSVRFANPGRVLLLDAGDLLQGNALTHVAAGAAGVPAPPAHPVMAAMNVMRYDAAVLGNHEFNYGVPVLSRALRDAGFPFVAANVRRANGTPFVAPSVLVRREIARNRSVLVGIVGVTTPGAMVWDADNLRAAQLTITEPIAAVRAAVEDVRSRGADIVVVLAHSGLDEPATYDTAATGLPSENIAGRLPREVPGIDIVVFGHSHRELVDSTVSTTAGGTLLVQPRNWAASLAVATLTLERTRGDWKVVERRGSRVLAAGHREQSAVLAASTRTHSTALAWISRAIGRTEVRWVADSARAVDSPIGDFVAEVMRRAGNADLAATPVFSLGASLDSGTISVAALSRLYPYENTVVVRRISGAQLRDFLEHSARYYRSLTADGGVPPSGIIDTTIPDFNYDVVAGVDYTIDLSQPVGARITRLAVRGRSVAPTDSFTIALSNYRASGGGGYSMLGAAPPVAQSDVDVRTLLIDEVSRRAARGEPLRPDDFWRRNWVLEPRVAREAAIAAGRARERQRANGGPL